MALDNIKDPQEGDPISAELISAIIAELRRQANLAVGAPLILTDTPAGRTIGLPLPRFIQTAVEIVGNKEKGVYTCIIGLLDVGTFDPDSDDASFDFHTFTAPFNAYFVNKAEEGKTDDNWLDAGGHYFGDLVGYADDGLPIILGHTFDTDDTCVEAAP